MEQPIVNGPTLNGSAPIWLGKLTQGSPNVAVTFGQLFNDLFNAGVQDNSRTMKVDNNRAETRCLDDEKTVPGTNKPVAKEVSGKNNNAKSADTALENGIPDATSRIDRSENGISKNAQPAKESQPVFVKENREPANARQGANCDATSEDDMPPEEQLVLIADPEMALQLVVMPQVLEVTTPSPVEGDAAMTENDGGAPEIALQLAVMPQVPEVTAPPPVEGDTAATGNNGATAATPVVVDDATFEIPAYSDAALQETKPVFAENVSAGDQLPQPLESVELVGASCIPRPEALESKVGLLSDDPQTGTRLTAGAVDSAFLAEVHHAPLSGVRTPHVAEVEPAQFEVPGQQPSSEAAPDQKVSGVAAFQADSGATRFVVAENAGQKEQASMTGQAVREQSPGVPSVAGPGNDAKDLQVEGRVVASSVQPGANQTEMIDKIAAAMKAAVRNGQQRLRMDLHPPNLGGMKIDLVLRDGVLSVSMRTDTSAARSLILANSENLKESLEKQDVHVGSFNVTTSGEGNQGFMNPFELRERMPSFGQAWRDEPRRAEVPAVSAGAGRRPSLRNQLVDLVA